jgi:hypothetical protein
MRLSETQIRELAGAKWNNLFHFPLGADTRDLPIAAGGHSSQSFPTHQQAIDSATMFAQC